MGDETLQRNGPGTKIGISACQKRGPQEGTPIKDPRRSEDVSASWCPGKRPHAREFSRPGQATVRNTGNEGMYQYHSAGGGGDQGGTGQRRLPASSR